MTTIAAGASATLTVTDGATVTLVSNPNDSARLTVTTGANAGSVVVSQHAGRKRYGPFGAGTLTLQSVSGYCTYYISTDGADDAERVITAVTLDATDLTGLNTAGKPIAKGVLLKDPTTKLVYGQSDGSGSYSGLGGSFTVASQAEAEAGTDNEKGMTPLRTAQAIAALGAASSGGGGGGGGDDVTAITLDGSDRIGAATVNGVEWTKTYNPDNTNLADTIALTGTDVAVNYSYVGGFPYVAGNINVGGAVTMTTAVAKVFRDEVLVAAGVAAAGFRIRITDLAFIINAAGTTQYRTCVLEWDGYQLNAVHGVRLETFLLATHTANSAESAALASLTLPGWLMGSFNRAHFESWTTVAGGASSTLATIHKINGTAFGGNQTSTTSSGGTPHNKVITVLQSISTTSQMVTPPTAMGSGYSSGTAAHLTNSINTETTDLAFTVTATMNVTDGARVATLRHAAITLVPR